MQNGYEIGSLLFNFNNSGRCTKIRATNFNLEKVDIFSLKDIEPGTVLNSPGKALEYLLLKSELLNPESVSVCLHASSSAANLLNFRAHMIDFLNISRPHVVYFGDKKRFTEDSTDTYCIACEHTNLYDFLGALCTILDSCQNSLMPIAEFETNKLSVIPEIAHYVERVKSFRHRQRGINTIHPFS